MIETTFAYRVRDALGKEHDGTLDAPSRDEAVQQLRRQGMQVLEIDEDVGTSLLAPSVRRTDVIYLTNQLAIMVDTGITLSTALEGIAAQEPNPTLKKVLNELKRMVEAGDDFSLALGKHPKLFDKTYISMIKVGEATGTLAEMLDRIAIYLRKEMEMRSKVKSAMAYPTIMAVMAIGVTTFLLTFILPKFAPIFAKKAASLPAPTKLAMAASGVLLNWWHLWVPGLILAIVGFVLYKRSPHGRRVWDGVLLNTPLIGTVCRKVAIGRSIRTLGTMLNSGLPVLDAIKLTSEVAGNSYYEAIWLKVLDEVTQGNEIWESLHGNPLFPPTLVQMISAGEQTAKLGDVLLKVSDYYDHEVESAIKTATGMIEPIMISVMGVVVGTIGLALLLPIFSIAKPG
jgi:type IV pilus assembly protein PilC